MPVQVSYPGVYIEEIASNQHVITGVPTSITAFIGRAVYGPVNEPITVFNYGDYENMFGGLSYDYPISYAVQDFFTNGGSHAVIVRLFEDETGAEMQTEANTAVKSVQDAVNTAASVANAKPADVVNAAKKAGSPKNFSTNHEKDAAALVVDAAVTASKVANATAATINTAVKAFTLPADFNVVQAAKASMTLDTFSWAAALVGAHSVIAASYDALFLADGSPATSATSNTLAVTVYNAARSQVQQISSSGNIYESKIAKQISLVLTKPATGDTPKKTVDNYIASIVGVINNSKDLPAAAKTGTAAYKSQLVTMDANFGADGYLKPGTTRKGIDSDLVTALATLTAPAKVDPSSQLTLLAANEGSWGGSLSATVDYNGITATVAEPYTKYGLLASDLFNLTVIFAKPNGQQQIESFPAVSIKDTKAPNRLDRVLTHQSLLASVPVDSDGSAELPSQIPPDGASGKASGGYDSEYLSPLTYLGDEGEKTGMYSLKKVDIFNLLCIPPDIRGTNTDSTVYTQALVLCVEKRAMLIPDPPVSWYDDAKTGRWTNISPSDPELGINGIDARNAAVYFPRVKMADLEMNQQVDVFPACGIIAGVMATTDLNYGVWKAPAGQNAGIMGIQALQINPTDDENGILNPLGINCLRNFPIIGPVVWGARTMRGADILDDPYKYVPVRRLTLYIESSLYQGTQWAVFEPNDESLWSALRMSVGSFLSDLQRQGALYNFSVTCDSSTTTPDDIDKGIVNIVVAIAPVKPAEFVIIKIVQTAATSGS